MITNLSGSPAVSVRGSFEIAYRDGSTATLEIGALDLARLDGDRRFSLNVDRDYPNDAAFGFGVRVLRQGTPYLMLDLRLPPVDETVPFFRITYQTGSDQK